MRFSSVPGTTCRSPVTESVENEFSPPPARNRRLSNGPPVASTFIKRTDHLMEAHLRYRKQLSSVAFGGTGVRKSVKRQLAPKTEAENHVENVANQKPEKRQKPRIDFIQRNIDTAANAPSRQKRVEPISRKQALIDSTHVPGAIPRYVAERNERLEIERSTPKEARCPPGMRMLSEQEKMDAISNLNSQKAEIERTLGHAPLRIESHAMQKHQRELEQQLNEIERSLEQLNRKYVFVPEE